MAICNVSTGYIPGGAAPAPSEACVVSTGGRRVLICPETALDAATTETFTIQPGQAAIIDAYNMVEDKRIYVQRVVRQAYCAGVGVACNPHDLRSVATAPQGPIAFYERMTLGSPDLWSLVKASGSSGAKSRLQLIVAVPGVYRLELEDPESQLGELEVEYMVMDLRDLHLPDAYFAGVA